MLSLKEFSIIICETANAGLAAKASKSGISIGTLRKVYRRGMAAWNSGHRPGTTPQQWAMARVNSYIGKGSGTYHGADKDLHENNLPEVPKDKESGLPQKYVAGLSAGTSKARAAHFKAKDKLSDSDPAAYEPAPGDATAKTKESEHTKKYRAMFGEDINEEIYEACWDSHKQVGMKKKGNRMVPDCVPKNEEVELEEEQTFEVGHAHNRTTRMRYSEIQANSVKDAIAKSKDKVKDHNLVHVYNKDKQTFHNPKTGRKMQDQFHEEVDAQFDLIEEVIEELALLHNLDSDYVWEKFEQFTDQELLEYAVDAKGHKSSTGGLTQKGRDAYNSKGANLQAPVTTSPSKLKAGSKAANRRKSFCARMGGMEGAMKKPNGEPTRKALALRKWNC